MNDINSVIQAAASQYGIDPNYLLRAGQIESSLNPSSVNRASGAAGLFQFIPSTARNYGLSNPLDPVANADAAARLTRDNMVTLRGAFGRDPTPGELYLAHQQGAGGALKLLSNPSAPAASIVGERAVTLNGGTPGMTAAQFAHLWTGRFDGKAPDVATAALGGAPKPAASFGDLLRPSTPGQPPSLNSVAMAYMQDQEQQAHQRKAAAKAEKQAKLAALFAPAGGSLL